MLKQSKYKISKKGKRQTKIRTIRIVAILVFGILIAGALIVWQAKSSGIRLSDIQQLIEK